MREAELEEILINNQFDFKAATQEFMKFINEDDKVNYYEVDEKTVQLRWTDIEIRKHRLHNVSIYPAESSPKVDSAKPDSPQSAKAASPPTTAITEVEDIKDYNETRDSE